MIVINQSKIKQLGVGQHIADKLRPLREFHFYCFLRLMGVKAMLNEFLVDCDGWQFDSWTLFFHFKLIPFNQPVIVIYSSLHHFNFSFLLFDNALFYLELCLCIFEIFYRIWNIVFHHIIKVTLFSLDHYNISLLQYIYSVILSSLQSLFFDCTKLTNQLLHEIGIINFTILTNFIKNIFRELIQLYFVIRGLAVCFFMLLLWRVHYQNAVRQLLYKEFNLQIYSLGILRVKSIIIISTLFIYITKQQFMKNPFFCLYFSTDDVKVQFFDTLNPPKRKKVSKKNGEISQQKIPEKNHIYAKIMKDYAAYSAQLAKIKQTRQQYQMRTKIERSQ